MHESLFGSELSVSASPAASLSPAAASIAGGGAFSAISGVEPGEGITTVMGDSFAPTPPFNFRVNKFGRFMLNGVFCKSPNEIYRIVIKLLLVFASFVVPYLAFLLILPGVREKRFASFIAITIQIGVGLLLMASLILPYWKVGEVTMVSQFYSHSRLRHEAHLSVNVGLEYINITLNYLSTLNTAKVPFRGLYLNERYHMSGVGVMSEELRAAYRRGLPYPLLKVMEYFSLSQGAFAWGRLYRNAGYYTNAVLWLAFACWMLQFVLLALVPHHYGKTGILCGILALLSDCVYVGNTPSTDVKIPFETRGGETLFLLLRYGSCIYMTFFAGIIAITFGFILSLLQFMRLYCISTCLSGYLDDTVGPKCKWGNNNKVNDNKRIPIEMQSVTKSKGVVATTNGWATMNSSATASTTASSTSSTNGDNTETYITDETASANDVTSVVPERAKHSPRSLTIERQNAHANRQRLMPDSPDSGLAVSRNRSKNENNNNTIGKTEQLGTTELYKRRQNGGKSTWNPPTLKLPLTDEDDKTLKNCKMRSSTLMSFVSASPSLNGLTPQSAMTSTKSSSPIRGESSGFQSSRSSFSDCSLVADDDEVEITTRQNSSAIGNAFFRFTDDEDDDQDANSGTLGNTKYQQSNLQKQPPKRSLFRVQ